jgi:hypothetical protein
MFIRSKVVNGDTYYAIVESYRDGARIRHRQVLSLGRSPDVESAITAVTRASRQVERRMALLKGCAARGSLRLEFERLQAALLRYEMKLTELRAVRRKMKVRSANKLDIPLALQVGGEGRSSGAKRPREAPEPYGKTYLAGRGDQTTDVLVDSEKGVLATVVQENIMRLPHLDRVKLTHLAIGHFGDGSFLVVADWCEMNGLWGKRMQRDGRFWPMDQPVLIIEGDDVDIKTDRLGLLPPHSDHAARTRVWRDIVKQARESGRTILVDAVDRAFASGSEAAA